MVLVTGANGFIGSCFIWELNRAGITDIVAVDLVPVEERPQLLANQKYSHFYNHNQVWEFLETPAAKKIKWIVHMGANSSTTETNLALLDSINTQYTQKIWLWCVKNQVPLIYASSAATYGDGSLGFSDAIPAINLKPLNLYGHSKSKLDAWVETIKADSSKCPPYWYGLKFFNVYGPNEYHKGPMASLVGKALEQLKTEGQIRLFKSYDPKYQDGGQLRDFIYIKDVTSWMLELTQKTPQSGIYNMGFGKARSWLHLAHAVIQSSKINGHVEFIEMPENLKKAYQYFTEADMNRWQNLNMSPPKWPLESGISDYVTSYLLSETENGRYIQNGKDSK